MATIPMSAFTKKQWDAIGVQDAAVIQGSPVTAESSAQTKPPKPNIGRHFSLGPFEASLSFNEHNHFTLLLFQRKGNDVEMVSRYYGELSELREFIKFLTDEAAVERVKQAGRENK